MTTIVARFRFTNPALDIGSVSDLERCPLHGIDAALPAKPGLPECRFQVDRAKTPIHVVMLTVRLIGEPNKALLAANQCG